ncbi:hypothetical protein Hanom_Chr16g01425501 [Helianthus anomalus]
MNRHKLLLTIFKTYMYFRKPSGCARPLLLKKVVYVSRCHLSVLYYHLLMDLFAISRLLAVT